MKKTIVHLLCCFILYRPWRKKIRAFLINTNFVGFYNYIHFYLCPIGQNSVLVIEPNDCHGEVVPGYTEYFLKLGYQVDIFLNSAIASQSPFCRMKNTNIRCFSFAFCILQWACCCKKVKQYKYIMVTSSSYYHKVKDGLPLSSLDVLKLRELSNVIVVEHDIVNIERLSEENLVNKNKLVTLMNLKQGTAINPHYFGNVTYKPKNSTTTFVVVGGINPKRKNHTLLIDAIQKLLSQGVTNFKINIIGRGNLKSLPSEIRQYVKIKGFLNFPAMYKEMENADFFLPLLDENNPDHERYITTGVTGSTQLIYAFATPPIIHPKFAKFYGFDCDNSFVYDDDFAKAMMDALNLNNDEYAKMQNNLKSLAAGIYEQSLSNLSKILKREK